MKEEPNILFLTKDRALKLCFVVFLLLIVATRVLVFFQVNLPWIDSDQPFMWAGVKDYAEGRFYEPRFYGQNYNTFMEALFAVPLFWLHLPVYYALPLATHVISLFPFLFTAFYLFFHHKKENALFVLAVPLCLTTGYDILNSIPRGFVTGLFFTSFFVISLLNPRAIKFILLNTVLSVVGFFVNPNSILVSLPFLFYLFLHNYNSKKYYYTSLLALLSAVPLYFIFDWFYKIHPSYVVLELQYSITPAYFLDILAHLDDHFAHISFFVEENCLSLLLVLFLLSVALFRKNTKAGYAFLSFFGVLLLSFFSAKTKDGVVWPFYSYSRMFLGIPVLIALMSAAVPLKSKTFLSCVVLLSLVFSAWKFYHFKRAVDYHTKVESRWNGVHLISLSSVREALDFYKSSCRNNASGRLLISNTFWLCTYMNYGGPAIMNDFPATEETDAERRYWVREGNKNKVFSRFIFLSVNYNFDKLTAARHDFNVKRLDDYGLFLIENNTLKNGDFIKLVRACEKN